MRARAQAKSLPYNSRKAWEEADTRDDVVKAVIDRELYNAALATKMTRDLLDEMGIEKSPTWQETLERAAARRLGGLIAKYDLEFEDGSTEEIEINVSAVAIINSGYATELGLV